MYEEESTCYHKEHTKHLITPSLSLFAYIKIWMTSPPEEETEINTIGKKLPVDSILHTVKTITTGYWKYVIFFQFICFRV